MIPYISLTTFSLGPVTIYAWGIFVAIGFFVGGFAAARFAKKRGDDPNVIWDLVVLMMACGMIGGRIGHILFYAPLQYLAHPLSVFAIWEGGLSWFGGMIACVIAGYWYAQKKHLPLLRYADVVAFGLPFGKMIGRLGCFVIHDHPGIPTSWFFGVRYPDGIVRHDLGLELSMSAALLAIVMLLLSQEARPDGTFVATFLLWYGASRILLDCFRVADIRYLYLTPGQWFGIASVIFGAYLVMWIKTRPKIA